MKLGIRGGVLTQLDRVRWAPGKPAPVQRDPQSQRAFVRRVMKRRKHKGYAVHKLLCENPQCSKCGS